MHRFIYDYFVDKITFGDIKSHLKINKKLLNLLKIQNIYLYKKIKLRPRGFLKYIKILIDLYPRRRFDRFTTSYVI